MGISCLHLPYLLLGCKFQHGRTYDIYNKSNEIITLFAVEDCFAVFTPTNPNYYLNLRAGHIYVFSVNSLIQGTNVRSYNMRIFSPLMPQAPSVDYSVNFRISTSVDNRGTNVCDSDDDAISREVEQYHCYFLTPYGGVDYIGTVNLETISGIQGSLPTLLSRLNFSHDGDFIKSNIPHYKYSSNRQSSIGTSGAISFSFKTRLNHVDAFWVMQLQASKRMYMRRNVRDMQLFYDCMVGSVGVTKDIDENGEPYWELSIQVNQVTPLYS
jgi:hypothetical protein